jgi:hypothetical protein
MNETWIKETYDHLLAGAREALAQGGSFAPFGAGTMEDGRRTHLRLDTKAEGADAQSHIALLVSAFRDQRAQGLVCAGLAFDGQVRLDGGEASDAVCMHIEVRGGESLEAFTPYVRMPEGLSFLNPIFAPTDPEIFARA